MIFGGLSEKEVSGISDLLNDQNIKFDVQLDDNMMDSNDQSIQNDLRYLKAPSISQNILSIEINDEVFGEMSNDLKNQLLEFGISNEVPSEYEFAHELGVDADPAPVRETKVAIKTSRLLSILGLASFIILIVYQFLS